MSDEPKRLLRAWIGWMAVAAPVLYVLSIGPTFRAVGVSILVLPAYRPVFEIANKTGIRQPLAWYLNAWAPKTMTVDSDPDSGFFIWQPPSTP